MVSQGKLPRRVVPWTRLDPRSPLPARLSALNALPELFDTTVLPEILPTSAYFEYEMDEFGGKCEKTEPLHWYGWDKLHPIYLGSRFCNDRFEVVHKLDHDRDKGTSWLVRDLQESKWRRLDVGWASEERFEVDMRLGLEEMRRRKHVALCLSEGKGNAGARDDGAKDSGAKDSGAKDSGVKDSGVKEDAGSTIITGEDSDSTTVIGEDADSTNYDIVAKEDADSTNHDTDTDADSPSDAESTNYDFVTREDAESINLDNANNNLATARWDAESVDDNIPWPHSVGCYTLCLFQLLGPNGRHVCRISPLNNLIREKQLWMTEEWFVRRCWVLRAQQHPPREGPNTVHDITYREMMRILGHPQIILVTPELCPLAGVPRHVVLGTNCPRYLVVRSNAIGKEVEEVAEAANLKNEAEAATRAEKRGEAAAGLTPLPLKIWKGVSRAFR